MGIINSHLESIFAAPNDTKSSLPNTRISGITPSPAIPIDDEFPFFTKINKVNIKILFLDVDGVLNKSTTWKLDDNLLKYLREIIEKTKCKLVLSTSWRLNKIWKQSLLHCLEHRADINIDDVVIGDTKSLKQNGKNRVDEIKHYLETNDCRFNVISWCILDDYPLDSYNKESAQFINHHFIQTNPKWGLTPQNVSHCIRILNQFDDN